MELKHEIKRIVEDRMRAHPLSTLDDMVQIESSNPLKIGIEFLFDAKKNRFDFYESNKGDAILKYLPQARELLICNIFINNKYRNKGYGVLFVRTIEDIATQLNANSIVVKNSVRNAFWEHIGYNRIEGRYADYKRDLSSEKSL
ncbi:MAG: GNAT family N-acetyltransferase [Candidatus Woesearchaeota archaeon]